MKTTYSLSLSLLLLLLLFPLGSLSSTGEGPSEVIRQASENFLETIEKQKSRSDSTGTDELVKPFLSVLEPVVDFQAIASGIMGRHAEKASPEQIEKFTAVFKEWLVRYYLDNLLGFSIENIAVDGQPAGFNAGEKSASVRTVATDASGKTYEVRYSMRKDSSGEWQVRNIIIEGVNIGLTYLNQFDGAMNRYDNDIDTVIANWSEEMAREGGSKP